MKIKMNIDRYIEINTDEDLAINKYKQDVNINKYEYLAINIDKK